LVVGRLHRLSLGRIVYLLTGLKLLRLVARPMIQFLFSLGYFRDPGI
jgi:hypothetical protein